MVTRTQFLIGNSSLLLIAVLGNADEPKVESARQDVNSPATEQPQESSAMQYAAARKEFLSHLADFAADRHRSWAIARAESFPNADRVYDHRIWVTAPAMTKLKEIRDQAKRSVMAGTDVRDSFQTLKSINDLFGEQAVTNEVFAVLDEKSPELAKAVFDIAKSSLVQGKSYAMLGKYAVPKDDFVEMRDAYRREKVSEARSGVGHWRMANECFANDVLSLVSILAINGRGEEAEEIAALARAEWDDRSFRSDLANALDGVVPDH